MFNCSSFVVFVLPVCFVRPMASPITFVCPLLEVCNCGKENIVRNPSYRRKRNAQANSLTTHHIRLSVSYHERQWQHPAHPPQLQQRHSRQSQRRNRPSDTVNLTPWRKQKVVLTAADCSTANVLPAFTAPVPDCTLAAIEPMPISQNLHLVCVLAHLPLYHC